MKNNKQAVLHNSSLALSYLAKNKQKFSKKVLDNIIQSINHEDRIVRENIAETIGYYASVDVQAIATKHVVQALLNSIYKHGQHDYTDFLQKIAKKYIQAIRNADPNKGEVISGDIIALHVLAHIKECPIIVHSEGGIIR